MPPLEVPHADVGALRGTLGIEDETMGEPSPEMASIPAALTAEVIIHPQPTVRGGSSTGGDIGECSRRVYFSVLIFAIEWLLFPQNRDQLVQYLVRGLSLRFLFPTRGTEGRENLVCKGELELTGNEWTYMGLCNKRHRSLESLQRHIIRRHLHAHKVSFSLEEILAGTFYAPISFDLFGLNDMQRGGHTTTTPLAS